MSVWLLFIYTMHNPQCWIGIRMGMTADEASSFNRNIYTVRAGDLDLDESQRIAKLPHVVACWCFKGPIPTTNYVPFWEKK